MGQKEEVKMQKRSACRHNCIDNSKRSLIKKALYNTPKLLLLGSMTVAPPAEGAGSNVLGYPPDPPPSSRKPQQNDWLFSE